MNENKMLENDNTQDCLSPQNEFLDSLKKTNGSYLTVVIVSACIAACGIAVTLLLHLWLGIGVTFSSAIAYILFTKAILNKNLGISYQSTSGELTVTKLCAKGKSEVFVPRRLLWLDVTKIESRAFECENASELQALHLPNTLNEIGECVFEGCTALKTVYFQGSREEWDKIDKKTDFGALEIIFEDSAEYEIKKQSQKNSKAAAAQENDEAESEAEDNG